MKKKYTVKVLFMGMWSEPKEFDTREDAEREVREIRRLPGLVPLLEEMDE